MIVSILPHSTYLVNPVRKPAIILEFIKKDERVCVLAYPELPNDKEEFVTLFERFSGFVWNPPSVDWDVHNAMIIDKIDQPMRELFNT